MSTSTNGHARPALSPELLDAAKSAVANAVAATFNPDPLLSPGLSHTISVIGSMVKRHGIQIEHAVAEGLERSERFIVMRNVAMPITIAAESLVAGNAPAELTALSIGCDTESRQTAFLDLVAIDIYGGRAIIAEIKRGSGPTELKKRRQTERLLRCAKLQGRSFLRKLGYEIASVDAVVIDYCGRSGFPPDLTVTREGLDPLFGVPVVETVEAMTNVMQRALRDALPGLLDLARVHDIVLVDTGFETPTRI